MLKGNVIHFSRTFQKNLSFHDLREPCFTQLYSPATAAMKQRTVKIPRKRPTRKVVQLMLCKKKKKLLKHE